MKIFIEGGGDSEKLQSECQRAFTRFFEKAGLKDRRLMPRVVACGGRGVAYDRFCTAHQQGEAALLLVDAEAVVATHPGTGRPVGPWAHLRQRDHWACPAGATNGHVHLMAVCMEAWFVADRNAFLTYYSTGNRRANPNALPVLPAPANVEGLGKQQVFQWLAAASAPSGPMSYRKGSRSFDILAALNPEEVAKASYHARRLFCRLGVTWWTWLDCQELATHETN